MYRVSVEVSTAHASHTEDLYSKSNYFLSLFIFSRIFIFFSLCGYIRTENRLPRLRSMGVPHDPKCVCPFCPEIPESDDEVCDFVHRSGLHMFRKGTKGEILRVKF